MVKHPNGKEYPLVSFVTPTFNSSHYIEDSLKSILTQEYPKEKIEIVWADGGSTDNTLELAKKFGVKLVKNKLILGDPGFAVGGEVAKGEFVVFMGHDNQLVQKDWIKRMLKPFIDDQEIAAAYPHLDNKDTDSWMTKYVNRFTDPGNHFVYGYANNPLTFGKVYKTLKKAKGWVVYDFQLKNHPILEFEQGFMLRKSAYHRAKSTYYCGIMAVIDMIRLKKQFAYVPSASNYHETLDGGLKQFISKHRWAIDYQLDKRETFGMYKDKFGLKGRMRYISWYRRLRMYLYPFYGVSIVFPVLRALFMYLKDGDGEWFYHPLITFASAFTIWQEAFRIKVLGQSPIMERYS
jgi:glycosyltransferase involved in cell wall biosynthesis